MGCCRIEIASQYITMHLGSDHDLFFLGTGEQVNVFSPVHKMTMQILSHDVIKTVKQNDHKTTDGRRQSLQQENGKRVMR